MSEETDRPVAQPTSDNTPSHGLDGVLDTQHHHPHLADELFSIADVLGSDPAVRRAATDPAAPTEARQQLVSNLFEGKVSGEALYVAREATGLRWPTARALVSGLERQAIRSALGHAQASGDLDRVEDELFRLDRTVAGNPQLREALADDRQPVERRQDLVSSLLDSKASPTTVQLARRAVRARERTFANTVQGYITLAAAQRNRAMATVRVARALTPEQTDRLQNVLNKQLGRPVTMHVIVDESVLGGVRVEVGDEVIDGTVSGRLSEARRLFS